MTLELNTEHPGSAGEPDTTGEPTRIAPNDLVADAADLDADSLLDIVIPVYNEEADLALSVRRLHAYLLATFPYSFCITIADNASTDATWQRASQLATELPRVRAVHLDLKGRGRALKTVWMNSRAPVLAYMDVDLSTDLRALLPLIAPLISGHSDLAIGTRLRPASRVVRGPKREFISRSYNLIVRATLATRFSDAQCGFKAVRADIAGQLLPLVVDNNWFFDTEMLVLAERIGLRIHEIPVDWIDDPDSRVNIIDTAREDLRGIARLTTGLWTGTIPLNQVRGEVVLRRTTSSPIPRPSGGDEPPSVHMISAHHRRTPMAMAGQLARFCAIGLVSTVAYFALYLLLREPAGPQIANFSALLLTALGNTAANRRITFGISGGRRLLRHHLGGLAALGVGLIVTSGSLAALHRLDPTSSRWLEVTVLIVANALSTLVRFITLRQLMHHRS